MSYNVKGVDVDAFHQWIATYQDEVSGQLAMVAEAIGRLTELESFQGQAAESVKAYFDEVHGLILGSICTALGEMLASYDEYMHPYFSDIDTSRDFRLSQSSIMDACRCFSSSRGDFADKHQSLVDALAPVSDIAWLQAPSSYEIDCALFACAQRASTLDDRVSAHEDCHASRARALDPLISSLKALIASYGASATGGVAYMGGSVRDAPCFAGLCAALSVASTHVQQSAPYIQQAEDALGERLQGRQEVEEAKRREMEGWLQVIGAGIALTALVVGGLVCVATAGAATPAVIAVGLAAASTFQVSEIWEGADKIRLARQGNISDRAFNPMRDIMFGGNQDAYDVASGVVSFGAGFIMPAAGAVSAVRAGEMTAGKAFFSVGKEVATGAAVDFGVDAAAGGAGKALFGDTKSADYFKNAVDGLAGMRDFVKPGKAAGEDLEGGFGEKTLSQRRAELLEKNKLQGKAFAEEKFAEFKEMYPNALSEVTIELDDGTRIRVDAIAVDKDGNVVIQEYKSSATAGFTANQKHAYTKDQGVLKIGGTIVGAKGTGTFGEGVRIEAGDVVKVIRPD